MLIYNLMKQIPSWMNCDVESLEIKNKSVNKNMKAAPNFYSWLIYWLFFD